jgi:hypothetical protein
LLLLGVAVLPIRSAFFALTTDPGPLVLVQVLDGLSGATLGVLTVLVIADLTKGTGRFNLAQGLVGTVSGLGAVLIRIRAYRDRLRRRGRFLGYYGCRIAGRGNPLALYARD